MYIQKEKKEYVFVYELKYMRKYIQETWFSYTVFGGRDWEDGHKKGSQERNFSLEII